jgi:hypothetical protein
MVLTLVSERRSAIYSDRPKLILLGEILTGGMFIVFSPYGPVYVVKLVTDFTPADMRSKGGARCAVLYTKASTSELSRSISRSKLNPQL